jgi:hypothetical protein
MVKRGLWVFVEGSLTARVVRDAPSPLLAQIDHPFQAVLGPDGLMIEDAELFEVTQVAVAETDLVEGEVLKGAEIGKSLQLTGRKAFPLDPNRVTLESRASLRPFAGVLPGGLSGFVLLLEGLSNRPGGFPPEDRS